MWLNEHAEQSLSLKAVHDKTASKRNYFLPPKENKTETFSSLPPSASVLRLGSAAGWVIRPVKAHGKPKRPARPYRFRHAVGVADRAAEQLPVGHEQGECSEDTHRPVECGCS